MLLLLLLVQLFILLASMYKNEVQSSLPVGNPIGIGSRYLEHAVVMKDGLRWRLARDPYRILNPAGYDVKCNTDLSARSVFGREIQNVRRRELLA